MEVLKLLQDRSPNKPFVPTQTAALNLWAPIDLELGLNTILKGSFERASTTGRSRRGLRAGKPGPGLCELRVP